MLSVSEIVAKTEAMFDLFNHYFYNDELTRPARDKAYRASRHLRLDDHDVPFEQA